MICRKRRSHCTHSLHWLPLLSVALALALPAPAQQALSPQQQMARDIFEELIAIDTTNSSGDTTRAAEAVAKRLRQAGFPAGDVKVLAEKPRKGNLVARLRGSSNAKPILLLAHLDVVEAKREDWTVEPFKLLERDGYFYGRGTLDDKSMAAIFITNLIAMKRAGVVPKRDIILALTAEEEGGPDNGVDWLLQTHRDQVDAEFIINEGGGGRMQEGRYLFNGVQASEKTYADFELEATDKGGHSSLPTKDNPIYQLANALTRLEQFQFPVQLNDVTCTFFERMAAIEGGETGAAMAAIAKNPGDTAAAQHLAAIPNHNAQLRTTCVTTRVEAGHANNALQQRARAIVNCRVLPGNSVADVRTTLEKVIADDRVKIRVLDEPVPGPSSPLNPELLKTVTEITESMWPGAAVIPVMSSGASDSRYFRIAGIPAYGVSGIFVEANDVRAHGRDERLGVKQFYDAQVFLDRLVRALTS